MKIINIPYKKFTLNNGLTILVHEDHSNPLVRIDVTYHVGSGREIPGKSGLAHFFEHMMFEGSKHVKSGDHFKIITESGGSLNGSTNRDRTNYYETLPKNQLETGLWLEADRMGFLLDALTEEKFEIQRSTVKNERRQNYDNRPYGLLGEIQAQALYPFGHPYSWLTIGHMRDIDATSLEDLKQFFLHWYGPNNAVLTVGGDVDPDEVFRLAQKYFGSIPKGPDIPPASGEKVFLGPDRYISSEDSIQLPLIQMVFPSMPRFHEDEYALDCLAEIFGSGPNSILFQNMVKSQIAVNAFAYNATYELAGEFIAGAILKSGTDLGAIEKLIRDSFVEFEKRGVSEEDVRKFVSMRKSALLFSLSTISGKVSQLANYVTLTGDPGYINKDLQQYEKLTPEKVFSAYEKYIKAKPSLIISWLPKGQGSLKASEDNYSIPRKSGSEKEPTDIYQQHEVVEDLNRNQIPQSGKTPQISLPSIFHNDLSNGLKLLGMADNSLPILSISLANTGGQRLFGEQEKNAGLVNFMALMLNESTQNFSTEELAKKLDLLGSSIVVSSTTNQVKLSIQSLRENLDNTLEIAEEVLFNPGFKEVDFIRVKSQLIESLKNRENQAASIANIVFFKTLFEESHPQGNPTTGWLKTVGKFELQDLKEAHEKMFSPSNIEGVWVGDISETEANIKMEFLENLIDKNETLHEFETVAQQNSIFIVDKPDAAQSEIRIGYDTKLPYDPLGEHYQNILLNFPLGGDFNSRINQNLREKRGITYGARTSFSGDKFGGYFLASSAVQQEFTGLAVEEFLREMSQYSSEGMTKQEFEFMKSAISQRAALKFESPSQKSNFLARILRFGLPSNFPQLQMQLLESISLDQLNKQITKWVKPEKMAVVIVGNKKLIEPQLKSIDREVLELDIQGDQV